MQTGSLKLSAAALPTASGLVTDTQVGRRSFFLTSPKIAAFCARTTAMWPLFWGWLVQLYRWPPRGGRRLAGADACVQLGWGPIGGRLDIPNEGKHARRVRFRAISCHCRAFRAPTGVNVGTTAAVPINCPRFDPNGWGYLCWLVGQVFAA